MPSVNSTYTRRVRHFNRFYTRQTGLLDETLLDSDFSLTEARILYELALCDELTASQLGQDLGLDAGYLSRLIRKFEARGLLSRTRSSEDARRSLLSLTPAGRTAYKPLNRASQQKVAALLQQLPPDRQHALVNAMALIERLRRGDFKADIFPRFHTIDSHRSMPIPWRCDDNSIQSFMP